MMKKLLIMLTLVVLVFASSCAPQAQKVEYSQDLVCKQIVLFLTSVQDLQTASKFADKNALQAQFDVVRTNFNNLVQATANMDKSKTAALQTTVDKLYEAASQLPENISVSDAMVQLKQPITDVAVAAKAMQSDLKCPGV